jgi:hypothetical protein
MTIGTGIALFAAAIVIVGVVFAWLYVRMINKIIGK